MSPCSRRASACASTHPASRLGALSRPNGAMDFCRQAGTKRGRDEPNGTEEVRPRRRIRLTLEADAPLDPDIRDSSRRLPELKVHLNSEDKLQPVMAAVRFMYTGNLEERRQGQGQQRRQRQQRQQRKQRKQRQQRQQQGPQQGQGGSGDGGISTDEGARLHMSRLVCIRRLADYLQVQGCAEACDEALARCFDERSDGSSNGGGGSSRSSSVFSRSPLSPVLELFSCRHLLPSPEDDPRVRTVMAACRQSLVGNWGAPMRDGKDQPCKAEILAWLLGGGDAVRIANDRQLATLWYSLPVGILEELLQSDHHGRRGDGCGTGGGMDRSQGQWGDGGGQGARAAAAAAGQLQHNLPVRCAPQASLAAAQPRAAGGVHGALPPDLQASMAASGRRAGDVRHQQPVVRQAAAAVRTGGGRVVQVGDQL